MKALADSPREFHPLIDKAPARYVVGIDLGTTNSAVSYVDTHGSPWRIQLLAIPQLVASNQVETRETLPSYHFQAPLQNLGEGSLRLPWHAVDQDWCVGVMARDAQITISDVVCGKNVITTSE
jgi:molecular chaperone DnaK (HSP70)